MSDIANKICSCFKMTVDMKGLSKLEKYISDIEKENQQLKEQLQQSEEVIEEAKALIETHNNLERELQGTIRFNLVKLSNILNKYKKEESE